jgi:hypothetical protein
MGLASPRHAARRPRRALDAPHRAARPDPRFGPLNYLNGWWYGTADLFEFATVRFRLPGDLGGPMPRARAALLAIERNQQPLLHQIEPYLRATYLAARETLKVRTSRSRAGATVPGAILHEHYRLEAVCAGAFGEDGLVELALQPRWAPGRTFGAYVQNNHLIEFRASIGLWRTPL